MKAMLPQSTSSSHLLTYQNSTAGFKIEYPSFWQKSENITSNSSAVFFSEPLSGVRFTVANFKIPQTSLLNEPKNLILSTYLNGFTQSFQPYNVTQSNSTTVSGNPATKEELTYSYAGQPARIKILSSLIGDKVFILSYAATSENYALFLPTAQGMINSFSIIPTATTQLAAAQNSNSNNQQFVGTDFGNLSDLSNVPLIGGFIASKSVSTGILHNEYGIFIPWSKICAAGQQYLQKDCSQLIDPSTGDLTSDGDKAVSCIRNGALIAALAEKHGMSASSVLGLAAPIFGCGGVANLNQMQSSPYIQSILNLVEPRLP
jgi:hypothetical protein